ARLSGDILLQVNGDFQIDNMEGVAVHRDAAGDQVVTLISDDNFNHLLQRTLLLQFTLTDAQGTRRT
ncbi:esterase-like activity of phytase family protein, partial [Vibrio parahaemolyticus]